MSLSTAFLDELRARTLLSALVSKTLKLTKKGREFAACCPFHSEKTPSFYVNDEKGFYHCFGCGAHGDAIRWMTDQRGLPFIDAVKELAQAANLDMPAPDPREAQRAKRAKGLHDVMAAAAAWFEEQYAGLAGSSARAYVEKRGLTDAIRKAFTLGYAPDSKTSLRRALASFGDAMLVEAGLLIQVEDKEPYDRFRDRLMIPIRDPRGRVIAFGGRIIGVGEPKYLNSPDTPLFDKGRTLYNLDRAAPAARKANRMIVVEGYLDVIALAQAGIEEAVAPLGTALTEHQIERLWRVDEKPIVCFDGDKAGFKAADRAARRAMAILQPGLSMSFATLPADQDPDDVVREAGLNAFEKVLSSSLPMSAFVWQYELAEADLATPEGRAALGKALRDRAKEVIDEDLRRYYAGYFRQQVYEEVQNLRSNRGFSTDAGKWHREHRLPPELQAIRDYGMARSVYAPAVMQGLLRYPGVLGSHAEMVASASSLLISKELRLICQNMLDAALSDYRLTREALEDAINQEGNGHILKRMYDRQRVPYSFIKRNSDVAVAEDELRKVIEILVASPEIDEALKVATSELADQWSEEAFERQCYMGELKRTSEQELADALQNDDVA